MEINFMKRWLLLSAFSAGVFVLNAQANSNGSKEGGVSEKGSVYLRFGNDRPSVNNASAGLNSILGLGSDYSFVKIKEKTGTNGIHHETYRQLYRGIEVQGAAVILHSRNGFVQSITGRVLQGDLSRLSILPIISQEQARSFAMKELKVISPMGEYTPELVICHNYVQQPALAFRTRIDGRGTDGTLKMYHVYVDASSGTIINKVSLLAHADEDATAQTYYSGERTIVTDSYSGGYRLRDNGRKIETYDVNGIMPSGGATLFESPREYTNASTSWDERKYFMSSSLTSATDISMFDNLGLEFTGSAVEGNIFAGVINKEEGGVVENVYRNYALEFDGAGSLPLEFKSLFIPVVDGAAYTGQFIRDSLSIDISTGAVALLGSDEVRSANYEALATTIGSHSWSDSKGNAGTYSIEMMPEPALDAHWGIEETYDFYKEKFDHESFDDAGSPIINYYSGTLYLAGTTNNAMAIPAPYNAMAYGQGDGVGYRPFVTLDVTGHEYTHLVTGNTSNLEYQGESGALNESFSDMMGASIDFYAKGAAANWQLGDSIMIDIPYFRSMSDPKIVGTFGDPNTPAQPNTYKGEHWIPTTSSFDNGGVHINSGVGNYWFYLLSEGGSGTNDNGDSYTITPIGIDKAQQVAYHAFTEYLTESSQYIDAYHATLDVAEDLYGAGSAEYTTIRAAWNAVGIPETPGAAANNPAIARNLKLYPNPANGSFYIESSLSGTITADIFNIAGAKVMGGIILKPGTNHIDISSLSKGILMIQYQAADGMYSEKIINK